MQCPICDYPAPMFETNLGNAEGAAALECHQCGERVPVPAPPSPVLLDGAPLSLAAPAAAPPLTEAAPAAAESTSTDPPAPAPVPDPPATAPAPDPTQEGATPDASQA